MGVAVNRRKKPVWGMESIEKKGADVKKRLFL